MFSSSIQHYIIWIDKCHLLVHIIVEIHPFGILNELSMCPLATFSSPPWFHDELLFQEPAPIVHFSEDLAKSLRRFVLHLFFSVILSLRYHDTNQIWISVRYDGWNIFSRVITLVLIWSGKVMSCLAHLDGGPSVIVSFLTRLTIFPWGNWMPCLISYPDGSFVYPKSDLCLKTMSMLSRSMYVVLLSSIRTLGAQC